MRLHGAERAARLFILGVALLRVVTIAVLEGAPFWASGEGDVGGFALCGVLTIPGVAIAMAVNMALRGRGAARTTARCVVTLAAGVWALGWAEAAYSLPSLWSGPAAGWAYAALTYGLSSAVLLFAWRLQDRHAARQA